MSGIRLRALALTLSVLGGVVFLTVALLELRRGSLYHTALALGLAVLIVVSGRQEQAGLWGVLLLAVLTVYGVFRLWSDLLALGFL